MGRPQAPQLGEDWLRHRHPALFVALANDLNQTINAVDRGDLKCYSLADPQPASVRKQQGSSGNRVPYATKDCARLNVGEDVGQSSALGWADSFFEKSDQLRSRVWA